MTRTIAKYLHWQIISKPPMRYELSVQANGKMVTVYEGETKR